MIRWHGLMLLATTAVCAGPASGEMPAPPVAQADAERPNIFQDLVDGLVRENLPLEYEDLRRWGGTKEIVSGLSIRREGLKIETRRKRREVNHGTWKMYRAELQNPEERFHVRVENVGQASDGRLAFDIRMASDLRLFGRLSQWQTGVQLVSLSVDAEARVEMRMHCLLRSRLDVSRLPPEILFEPRVETAEIDIQHFRLGRISQLHGPLVRELSSSVREVLEDQIEKKRPQLVERINRKIEARQDRLRLSPRDLLDSSWGKLAAEHLRLDGGDQEAKP